MESGKSGKRAAGGRPYFTSPGAAYPPLGSPWPSAALLVALRGSVTPLQPMLKAGRNALRASKEVLCVCTSRHVHAPSLDVVVGVSDWEAING